MENSAKLLEDSLLVIWNDRQAERRLEAMQEVYAADIIFYESNEGPAIMGHQDINDLIAKLQEQWPAEFRFELNRPSLANHQVQHISWTLGIPGQTPVASGMDIAVIEEGKIKSLHLFLDPVGK
ncbi:nuclear transport factor 2 family protein [Mucilaginibacter sp. PAMB04168]|uniref:nuclear transport factor 2 family protein n=1 Tax=Mucilaginibacter sp. PAMB04168 TaxID=3138567 RepID=UPI0031F6B824